MSDFKLELDPVHLATALPTPFLAHELLGEGANQLQLLREAIGLARQLAQELRSQDGLECHVTGSKLVTAHVQGQALELPLSMSHIYLDADRIAFAACGIASYFQLCDVWVLRVKGGKAPQVAQIFADLGAIRYDLRSVCELGGQLDDPKSEVYRAHTEDTVHVKVVKNDGPEAEKRLVRELQLHFACHNHPCVAKIMGLFQVLDDPLGPGCALLLPCSESLFDQVIRGAAGPQILKGLLSAVHFLHQNEIFYRDLSPQSIQVAESTPQLADFSLALHLNELKRRPVHLGRPGYTAPEVLLNMEPTLQSDLFSVGAVLYFMLLKQQPFVHSDVETAVNQSIAQELDLPDVLGVEVRELLECLLERSATSRFDATAALRHSYVQAGGGVGPEAPAPSVAGRDWRRGFSGLGRHEPLAYRRRYLLSQGATRSLLQIMPFKSIKSLPEMSHTVWQTLELEGCLQVAILDDDVAEPYTPSVEPTPPSRVVTGSLRAPSHLKSCFHRQTSTGSSRSIRIDTGAAISAVEEAARGQPAQWLPQGAKLPETAEPVSRDMFGTCAFAQRTEDGQRRRFVKKLLEQEEDDFDDTASWQSWRSDAMLSNASGRSHGRSTSVASCLSNASAAAMRELLCQSEDESERDLPTVGHRGSLRAASPHQRLSIPGQDRRPIFQPTPPPRRDWSTCQYSKETTAGGHSRRMVRALADNQIVGAEEEIKRDLSWSSMAEMTQRSMSQASVISELAMGPTPSGDMMKELLHADVSPGSEVVRRSSRRGTAQQLQDLYKGQQ